MGLLQLSSTFDCLLRTAGEDLEAFGIGLVAGSHQASRGGLLPAMNLKVFGSGCWVSLFFWKCSENAGGLHVHFGSVWKLLPAAKVSKVGRRAW